MCTGKDVLYFWESPIVGYFLTIQRLRHWLESSFPVPTKGASLGSLKTSKHNRINLCRETNLLCASLPPTKFGYLEIPFACKFYPPTSLFWWIFLIHFAQMHIRWNNTWMLYWTWLMCCNLNMLNTL